MDVAFRADSSGQIGTGHLMRCLTLADALRARGARATFLMAPSGAAWREMIQARGHQLKIIEGGAAADAGAPLAHAAWLPWSQAADATASLTALDRPVDLMVVDHYALDARWETALRAKAARILAVDDIADRRHDCDALLDQNPQNPEIDRYAGLAPSTAQRFIGPRYALLRPQFAVERAARPAQSGRVKRIAVFMGGMDEAGATLWALEALAQPALAHIAVDVVLGGQSRQLAAVRQAVAARPGTTLHVDSADMARLVAAADLAIGAGGVAAIERCCLGLPTIAVSVAENQKPALAWLHRYGATAYLGDFSQTSPSALASALIALSVPEHLFEMHHRALSVTDGHGVDRIVEALVPRLTVRRADIDDARRLHNWRNDPAVRAVSFSSEPIAYEDHLGWLERTLADGREIILVGMMGPAPVGSLRYRLDVAAATVSIVIAPDYRGRGLGADLLLAGEAFLRGAGASIAEIRAEIRPDNGSSVRVFEKAGFRCAFEGEERLMYTKAF